MAKAKDKGAKTLTKRDAKKQTDEVSEVLGVSLLAQNTSPGGSGETALTLTIKAANGAMSESVVRPGQLEQLVVPPGCHLQIVVGGR